MIKQT